MTNRGCISLFIFILIVIIAVIGASYSARGQCNNIDIVILGDFSGSVGGHENFVIDAIESFTASIQGEGVRIGVALFDDTPRVISDLSGEALNLTQYRDLHARGGTNIEAALHMGVNLLLEEQNNSRKIIIMISDGEATSGGSPEQTLTTAGQINQIGIGICAVLVKSFTQRPEFLKQLSSGCYVETDYQNLAQELKNLNVCF